MSEVAALVSDHLDIWTAATERKNGAGRGGGKRMSLYGVERLRALIFDLAAAGRLEGNPNAAPEPLGKHVDLVMGQAPPGSACNTTGVGTVFVKTGEFGSVYPEVREWTTKPLKMAQAGDVLVCVVGATIGKLNLAIDCAIGRSVAAVRPKSSLYTRYLYYALMPYTLRLRRDARGSAQAVIGKSELNAVTIRVPSLKEQQQIVAKVDELMALCDALEGESAATLAAHQRLVETLLATLVNSADNADLAANWSRLEAHFDTLFTTEASVDALRQAILELAVSGRLMQHDDAGWPVVALKQVIGPMDSGWSPACHEYPASNDEKWGVLKTTAVQRLYYDESQNKALPLGLEPRPSAECQVGDILITRAGPMNRVGICCHVAETRRRLMISDKIIRFRPASEEVDGAFLALALSVGPAAKQIEIAKSGMAASQVNISQAKLKSVMVAVPPLPIQQEVVRRVHEFMRFCDELQNNIVDAGQTQIQLADAIVERVAA